MSEEAFSTCISQLQASLSHDRVLLDEDARRLHGQDVSGDVSLPVVVVRPEDTDELAGVMRVAAANDMVVVPRGGGMSYSSGYVCQHDRVICYDSSAMNEILEINQEDMYVTVQGGCTWKKLYEALEPLGLRTPFWGTLSGIHATVGGSLSQNSIFWGSSRYGSAADSVISFDVVLASGDILTTGSAAQEASLPFFRHFGPDLTGLFTADAGALGLKATATLKLIPVGDGRAYVSFEFESHDQLFPAMSEVSRQRLADACFGLDPSLQALRKQRDSLLNDAKALTGVIKNQGSVLAGIKEGVKVALAGRGFMDEEKFSVHYMIEEATQAAADAGADRIRSICLQAGGQEIENSIPKITRANPFGPLNNMIGPGGERWLPVHGLVPNSRAVEIYEAIEALFAENAEVMEQHGIFHAYLLSAIDAQCIVLEPVFYWPDTLNDLHRATVEDATLTRINNYPENPEGAAEVMRIRSELVQLLSDNGAVHLQIGRKYLYRDGISDVASDLVADFKKVLDPDGRINPGSLGL